MRRVLPLLGLVFLVGVLGAGLLVARAIWNVSVGKREAAQRELLASFERHLPQLEVDEARWAKDPLLAPRDGGNAAALFAEHLGWEPADAGLPPPRAPLSPEVRALLRATNDGGWLHLEDETIRAVDVTWLGELASYGFWDPDAEALAQVPFDVAQEPVPNTADLQAFAKVRLLQGFERGDVVAAGREVRELARLALTSESLVGSMVAVALLDLERKAFEAAVARGLEVSGWAPVSAADSERLRALLWAGPAMTSVLATGALAARPVQVGECAALKEGLGSAHFLRHYLEPELPARFAELDQRLERSPCRLVRLRTAWTSRESPTQLPATTRAFCVANAESEACAAPELPLALVPFSRSFIANTLVSIAMPDWFRQYERLAARDGG